MTLILITFALLSLGAWYVMRAYVPYDQIEKAYIVLLLKGISGALLAVAIGTFISLLFCYNPWFALPEDSDAIGTVSFDDSRRFMSMGLAVGINMIGIPMGFLIGIARANKELKKVSEN